jgi:hypothetical protein
LREWGTPDDPAIVHERSSHIADENLISLIALNLSVDFRGWLQLKQSEIFCVAIDARFSFLRRNNSRNVDDNCNCSGHPSRA